jgi:predicted nucleotidyltransferase
MASITRQFAEGSIISRDEIQLLVDDIVDRYHPAKVILFGSYAYGNPNSDSDVDLLVIMRHRGPAPKVAARIMLSCPHGFPVDLLVRSPMEIQRRITIGDSFLREITTKGIVLHESDDARMGR